MAAESDSVENISGNCNSSINSKSLDTASNASGSITRKKATIGKPIGNSIEDLTSSLTANSNGINNNNINKHLRHLETMPHIYYNNPSDRCGLQLDDEAIDALGPLPQKWEKAYTENGESYFIDHNTGTSHWLDPRLSKFQKKSLEDCLDDELPYGWEKIHDPQYGTYFIDHVNRRTQYENPVLEAKRRAERKCEPLPPLSQKSNNSFTRNPAELCGERLTTILLKSSRGLGFTIVGGDDNVDEFLQIKSIVPNGPAWLDGKLETGDILVYVNDTCVLGFTHHEMVNVFQSILPGETVTLEVCRGYPLPFDPNDPNTEVVTTIAVDGLNSDPEKARILMDFNMDGNYNFLDISDSLGAVGGSGGGVVIGVGGIQKNPLAKIQSGGSIKSDGSDNYINESKLTHEKPVNMNISIVKGAAMGFGFTIADSACGQKVKKILDGNCCKNLLEGDYLLAINNISVKHMTHSEVVQVLKDCPKGKEAILKIQRGTIYNGNLGGKGNRLRRSGDSARFNHQGIATTKDSRVGMYRSKTPTADLYSTQQKEILPARPKTPLVDTRNRAKTPSIDNNDELDVTVNNLDKLIDDKSISADVKSNNSFPDHDSINNDIPYMDPLPKLVSSLSERLGEVSLNQDQSNNLYHQIDHHHHHHHHHNARNKHFASQTDLNYDTHHGNDYYNNGYTVQDYANPHTNSYNTIYSPPSPLPIMAPVPTYHQDSCYCYECQDYGRHQQEYLMQSQYHYPPHSHNGRIQKRINEYMIDRRKAGFSPLESHLQYPTPSSSAMQHQHLQQQQQHHQQQQLHQQQQHQYHQQQTYWKYGPQSPPGSDPLGQPVQQEYTLSEVTLERQALGFGFRIVGGTEEGSQVTVGHIVPGGSADGDSRIASGDEILSIDGHNVVQASHHRVVQLMGEAALRGCVTMILRRKIRMFGHSTAVRYPYDVILSRNENEGFGFVISSSSQYYGSTIGKLIPGSPADRCEELKVDDRIIAVNRIDISGMSHGDIVNLIKESGLHVRLTIGSPKEMNGGLPSQSLSATSQGPPPPLPQLPPPPPLPINPPPLQDGNGSIPNKNEQFYDNFPMTSSHPQL